MTKEEFKALEKNNPQKNYYKTHYNNKNTTTILLK